jgi:hypothetical protein
MQEQADVQERAFIIGWEDRFLDSNQDGSNQHPASLYVEGVQRL